MCHLGWWPGLTARDQGPDPGTGILAAQGLADSPGPHTPAHTPASDGQLCSPCKWVCVR